MTRPPIEAPPCNTCGGDAWFPPEAGRAFGTVCETCLGSGADLRAAPFPGWLKFGLGCVVVAVAFCMLTATGALLGLAFR